MADPGYLDSLLRGAGQGATFNWGDEGAAKLLGALPGPKDPEGITREYAAGSPEADYLQKFRRDNASAAAANPKTYTLGNVLGAAPSAAAVPSAGGLSAAGRVAASGLAGGVLGGLAGAGGAEGGARTQGAARGALLGGLLGTGGGAAVEGANAAASALGRLRNPATSGAGLEQVQINYDRSPMLPPRRQSGPVEIPEIPKASNPGVRESMVPAMDELAERADVVHGDKVLGRPSTEKDVAGFAAARDRVKGLGPKPEVAQTETSVAKTVRPPKRKSAVRD